MKRVSAIIMIALFLFNLFGYKVFMHHLQEQADLQFEALIENQLYDENDLLTITVPLSLPYQNNQQDFERVNGEVTIKGKIYKYVKRKISDGNLVLLCLPDYNKMKIKSAGDDLFKYSNDLVQNQNSKKNSQSKAISLKNICLDFYLTNGETFNFYLAKNHKFQVVKQWSFFPSGFHNTLAKPPQFT